MLRTSVDAEIELARVMEATPTVEIRSVGRWIAKMQSLLAEVRRAKRREARDRENG